jgi:ectoine hydroxylase-related dioxygenase (phytanoyl-CoA dioxygenase family)
VILPDLSSEYPISPEQARRFREDGHILLRGLATREETEAYLPVILDARDRFGPQATPLAERDTYGKAFLKGSNLWEHDTAAARFVLARRFAKVAADLLGVSGVRIYHDQALIKEAGGGPTPWHQDQHYWPLATDDTITMWMPLVDVSPEMGTMHFASGSHRAGYLGDMRISDASEAWFAEYVRERGLPVSPPADMRAGDATFHYGWTLHGAPGNRTDRTRIVMTVIWHADGARISEPDNENRVKDLARWMPGAKPGDCAATRLNPLVYSRDH